jgi:hypothetical protein
VSPKPVPRSHPISPTRWPSSATPASSQFCDVQQSLRLSRPSFLRRCSPVSRLATKPRPFAGGSSTGEPSDGLEPSTPSLPWRFTGGTGGHGRPLAITFLLEIGPSRRVSCARECPRVPRLMYPSRTRGALSVFKTHDGTRSRLIAWSNRGRGIRRDANPRPRYARGSSGAHVGNGPKDKQAATSGQSSGAGDGGASRCAISAASSRLVTSSFRRMCETWTLAVFTLIVSSDAISRLV